MCEVCRQNPCHPSCPNAPDPVGVYTCVECGYGIFEGEKYFDSIKGPVCENCLDDMTTTELIELFGEELETA